MPPHVKEVLVCGIVQKGRKCHNLPLPPAVGIGRRCEPDGPKRGNVTQYDEKTGMHRFCGITAAPVVLNNGMFPHSVEIMTTSV